MKTKTLILSSVTTLFFSCEKDNKSTIGNTRKETITNKNITNPSDKIFIQNMNTLILRVKI